MACDHEKVKITVDGEDEKKCPICDDVDVETLDRRWES